MYHQMIVLQCIGDRRITVLWYLCLWGPCIVNRISSYSVIVVLLRVNKLSNNKMFFVVFFSVWHIHERPPRVH